jgi:hypothetical protein
MRILFIQLIAVKDSMIEYSGRFSDRVIIQSKSFLSIPYHHLIGNHPLWISNNAPFNPLTCSLRRAQDRQDSASSGCFLFLHSEVILSPQRPERAEGSKETAFQQLSDLIQVP